MENIDFTVPDPVYGDYPMDLLFAKRVREITEEYNITTFVETGVDKASTAMTASKICQRYIGVEKSYDSCTLARKRFADAGITNAEIIQGNSPVVLLDIMHTLDVEHTIFFLDAHWGAYWPLLDEIDTISRGKGVIIIHDFQVPGHPELGWMEHGGKILNYDYVKDALTRWSPTHRIEYNTEALHLHLRGIMYIFPS